MLEHLAAAAGPTKKRPPFTFSAFMRVGFDETDAQQVVYYGRYFPYFDRARVEYLRHLGLLAMRTGGLEFVMRRAVASTRPRPASTTRSRSSSAPPGSAARPRPTSSRPGTPSATSSS